MAHADIVEEASALIVAASGKNLSLRLMGGIAVYLRSTTAARRPELARAYADIDLVAPKRSARQLTELLTKAGYTPNQQFNALNGSSRMLFYDQKYQRQIDVFMGSFSMCHSLNLESRIVLAGPALSPSDLLLLKLQIVQLNKKDVTDTLALLLSHEPTPKDEAHTLSTGYIANVCAADWGWYTTLSDNLKEVAARAESILPAPDAATVKRRAGQLVQSLDNAPKSLGWKLRDKIGRRKIWYALPEEVQR